MKDLTEPLLPELHQDRNQDICEKKSINLSRLGTVLVITFTTFILLLIILAAQLPPQQTMGMTTIGSQTLFSNLDNLGWVRTIYGEYKLFPDICLAGCDFDEAVAVCEEQGGHLPFIQSEEENEEVKNILSTSPQSVWIGLISKYRTGSWQLYKTEDAATYFNFLTEDNEESHQSHDDEDVRCVILEVDDGGKWIKTGCSQRKDDKGGLVGVICQRLPNVTEDVSMRVMMGKSACDDGQKGIERDLQNLERDTECNEKHNNDDKIVKLKEGTETMAEHCDKIHEKYVPNHVCMNQAVDYSGFGIIPTHGPHRPNWASFGEYSYLPIERWQHNLEHGCVVLLYHPCLDHHEVTMVKSVLSGCMRKHIITPSRLPSLTRPLMLLAWGCYLEFQFQDLDRMRSFISSHALGGPEGNYTKDGLYTHLQIVKAEIPEGSDRKDSIVCPPL
eukprot:GFUD01088124.1.p1 GENE.GFUD01088124.1~~GFUD01088124.1.p1  ORF type:complete len:445 (+),score=112.56 GFUD01088124.1:203-1537(+)